MPITSTILIQPQWGSWNRKEMTCPPIGHTSVVPYAALSKLKDPSHFHLDNLHHRACATDIALLILVYTSLATIHRTVQSITCCFGMLIMLSREFRVGIGKLRTGREIPIVRSSGRSQQLDQCVDPYITWSSSLIRFP